VISIKGGARHTSATVEVSLPKLTFIMAIKFHICVTFHCVNVYATRLKTYHMVCHIFLVFQAHNEASKLTKVVKNCRNTHKCQ